MSSLPNIHLPQLCGAFQILLLQPGSKQKVHFDERTFLLPFCDLQVFPDVLPQGCIGI